MARSRTLRSAAFAAAFGAATACSFAALAKPEKPASGEVDPAAKTKAAQKFREAEKLFKRHDYAAAAAAFEEAYTIAPHPAALFNAATAHQKAGELTKAANLCSRYLRDAPADDSRREKANALIGELTPKLGRVQIEDHGAQDVTLDGESPELEVMYVDPGDHTVTGKFGGKTVQRRISVPAGSLTKVALEAPKKDTGDLEEEGKEGGEEASADVKKDSAREAKKPLSPTVFYVGVGATVVLGGLTVWSGIDTNRARDNFDAEPTQAGLDDGKSKQKRTNILLAGTVVAGAATAVVGVFFTNWKGENKSSEAPQARVWPLLGPGVLGAEGVF